MYDFAVARGQDIVGASFYEVKETTAVLVFIAEGKLHLFRYANSFGLPMIRERIIGLPASLTWPASTRASSSSFSPDRPSLQADPHNSSSGTCIRRRTGKYCRPIALFHRGFFFTSEQAALHAVLSFVDLKADLLSRIAFFTVTVSPSTCTRPLFGKSILSTTPRKFLLFHSPSICQTDFRTEKLPVPRSGTGVSFSILLIFVFILK